MLKGTTLVHRICSNLFVQPSTKQTKFCTWCCWCSFVHLYLQQPFEN
jgi:hypothetical protein